ncbi:MAG: 16S rRNA (cytosine(1402)-N(4))-methyltransferase RsmH, partial [Actinobacteria bacterium]|nr:16S rRNA (cytosine(1402)-N(4))-methyltransferase RsmH [Actinomycetota bacterium]
QGDEPLDMRFDAQTGEGPTAAELLNELPEAELARIFREYGEEPRARRLASVVARRRERAPLERTDDLVAAVTQALGPKRSRIHPATRAFQALRIAVNDELGQLDAALPLAWSLLRESGRFAGISFHSLEDRRVKRFLVARAQGCICPPDLPICACGREPEAELVSRRAIAPTPGEVAANPRSRSARLRVASKLGEDQR